MNNDNPDNAFKDVAKMSGKQYAEEFDESVTKENLSELDRKIYRMALEYRGQTKKKKLAILKTASIVAAISILFGGTFTYQIRSILIDKGTHTSIVSFENTFHYMIAPPDGYSLNNMNKIGNESKAIYSDDNADNFLVFLESGAALAIDTEGIEIEYSYLSNGYQCVYYEKNGHHLFWEQYGYYYYLYSNSTHLDIKNLATTLSAT